MISEIWNLSFFFNFASIIQIKVIWINYPIVFLIKETVNHINKGKPFPLGSSLTSKGVNFSLVATNAEYVEILLFESEDSVSPENIFQLGNNNNTGPYWHAEISNLKEGCIYAFRVKQKNNGINNNYEKKVLLDPCSRGITGWGSYIRENALK